MAPLCIEQTAGDRASLSSQTCLGQLTGSCLNVCGFHSCLSQFTSAINWSLPLPSNDVTIRYPLKAALSR